MYTLTYIKHNIETQLCNCKNVMSVFFYFSYYDVIINFLYFFVIIM